MYYVIRIWWQSVEHLLQWVSCATTAKTCLRSLKTAEDPVEAHRYNSSEIFKAHPGLLTTEDKFNCKLITDVSISTTLSHTCLDLIFFENIQITGQNYISYFSCHRPILTKIVCQNFKIVE